MNSRCRSHYTVDSKDVQLLLTHHLDERIIFHYFIFSRPLKSPELPAMDFLMWGYLISKAHSPNPKLCQDAINTFFLIRYALQYNPYLPHVNCHRV
ncbi:hypothetical protein NPIL_476241 [Nephila pilipes]|uniref:Uncharacterized protein n=1 Tax=Nephila pilipes TaxID=299642 RepID=A0A8X6U902_NEPPI|nr:hypothetical protein NPIL_476241 [Nephila pilipes]